MSKLWIALMGEDHSYDWLSELGVTKEEYFDFLRCQGEYALAHASWETSDVGGITVCRHIAG